MFCDVLAVPLVPIKLVDFRRVGYSLHCTTMRYTLPFAIVADAFSSEPLFDAADAAIVGNIRRTQANPTFWTSGQRRLRGAIRPLVASILMVVTASRTIVELMGLV
jgi:hypothetical protein